jgi:hypothetical protein
LLGRPWLVLPFLLLGQVGALWLSRRQLVRQRGLFHQLLFALFILSDCFWRLRWL